MTTRILYIAVGVALLLMGCTPTVAVAPPEGPIELNINVKIEHEIRVQVDKELDDMFGEDSELF